MNDVTGHFADRLTAAIQARGAPAVVALDPVAARLPLELRGGFAPGDDAGAAALDAVMGYSRRVVRVIAPIVPAVKINSAYFERFGGDGVAGYYELVREARAAELVVIGDVKRGDVGHSSQQYAEAHLSGRSVGGGPDRSAPDAVTINGYFGWDGAAPFVEVARRNAGGLFVLVRTSNESAAAIQDIPTADGRKVHEHVAAEVARWADDPATIGRSGYSFIGAVVGTRNADDARALRAAMPRSIFLVPGYGAQGGGAEDARAYFKADGGGAIVAAGRSVIYAYDQPQYAGTAGASWERCVEAACRAFVEDLRRVVE